jgi:hypothetical protein
MNDILHKVQIYLDKVSQAPVEVSNELVEEFGEACKKALRKQFSDERKDKFQIRMSNIGRPLCQLQMESKNIKGEGQPYNAKMRNTFGDLIEALAIFVMKSAGVNIEDQHKKVVYKYNSSKIEGEYDVRIDKKIWDIKSASPYSFDKKFGENGGFGAIAEDDSFGYIPQGYLYAESEKLPFGGWIAINKSTGEWTVCETPIEDSEYRKKALSTAKENAKALKANQTFKRCYSEIEETFRGKKTGNKVLNTICSFCPYKIPCWGKKLQMLPQQQSQGKNPKWVWYTEVNNPRKEDEYNTQSES